MKRLLFTDEWDMKISKMADSISQLLEKSNTDKNIKKICKMF